MFRRKHTSRFDSTDADQRKAKINELKSALGPLSARGGKYCSVACLARYLEARNWNVAKARKMLEESLKWRAAYRPEDIRWPEVSVEAETGKMYRASFQDREGRTVLVMAPAKQNTSSHEGQIRFLVYTLENAVLNLPEGQEKMVWLIDFTGWTMANAVPIKTARETTNILQNHYPERLAVAFLFNPPKVFEAFWKVVKYFLDPTSIEKVKFVYLKDEESMKVMHKYIDPKVIPVEFGGESDVHPARLPPSPLSCRASLLIRSKLPIPTNEIGEYRANGIKYCSSTFQKATIMRSWIVKWAVKSTAYIFLTLTHAAITLLRTPWMLVEKKTLIDILKKKSISRQSTFFPPRHQLFGDFCVQRNATRNCLVRGNFLILVL